MCRVLFAVGEGEKIRELLDAFVKASENDPYKAAGGRGNQHRDGWGYVVMKNGSIEHYRSERPVFEDEPAVERLSESLSGFTVLLTHSRAASQGSKGLFNAQPFAFSTRRGFSFWLYHNGDLDKAKIIEIAEFGEKDFEKASDSYAFAAYLCRKLESTSPDDLKKHYSLIASTARTSFNTGTLFLDSDGSFSAFVTAYSKPNYIAKRENWDYVKQIVLREKNLFVVGSSTLGLYYDANWKEVENGSAFYLKIGKGNFEVKGIKLGV